MSIYWGAYENGPATYGHYYGPNDPNGDPWRDGPWSISDSDNTFARFNQNAGKKISILHWGQPFPNNQSFDAKIAGAVVAKGVIPLIDTGEGVALVDVAAGKYDSALKAWATAVREFGHPFFYRPWWEMNGGWYPWGTPTPAQTYIAAWRHMHKVIAPIAPNVTWLWSPNIGSISAANARYPGASYVDWVGLDGYSQNPRTVESFYNIFKTSYDNIVKYNKPLIIVETGCLEYAPGVKANWITDAFTKQLPTNFPQVQGVCWFNWLNGTNKSWPIESSSSTQAAFKKAIANSYYKSGGNANNLPLLTKVPRPT